ncbi:MAG: molybdate transport system ATP-binding protein [Oleispira sp.]|jgi:molybdate transport system ATP-binding protein
MMNNSRLAVRAIQFKDFNGYLANSSSNPLNMAHKGSYAIRNLNWQVKQGEHWVLLGKNGSGKSALTATLIGQAVRESGERNSTIKHVAIVSSDAQKQLLNQELVREQEDDAPSLVRDIIYSASAAADNANSFDVDLCQQLIEAFDFERLLSRHFRDLSTGETRKLLLIKALSAKPALIVLDEPFEGLDAHSVTKLRDILDALSSDERTDISFILVLNRLDHIPAFVTHYGYVNNGQLQHTLANPAEEQITDLLKLLHIGTTSLSIPKAEHSQVDKAFTGEVLVNLQNAKVAYGGEAVFKNLNWTIKKHQHWQLTGRNGSGKTCLLNLITGDNPQCYNNDIKVFGYQRGNGESIWQIKQHIGYISNALHMDYRVGVSALNTIISGFFDSIGLYQPPTDEQKNIAMQWLQLLGLDNKQGTPFTQFSYGDQRMLLIARAMVKHPTLLILDEPCLGLDEANRLRVLMLIEKICEASVGGVSGSTVIYVNHHREDRIKGIDHYLAMEDFN